MERIIDGFLYESKTIPDAWEIRTFEINGHREISARNVVVWEEVKYLPPNPHYRHGDGYKGEPTAANVALWAAQDAADKEHRRQKSLEASCRRAKTRCRRGIKSEGFDEMLTLTYRSNQNNLELAKKHLKEWIRRMKKAIPGFRYCGAHEPQGRGAIHWHIMTHKLPVMADYKGVKLKAFDLGTRVWRDVIGDYPFHGPLLPGTSFPIVTNGLCFIGGKTKHGAPRGPMSPGRAAHYVSAYILKGFTLAPEEKNRYSHSDGMAVPKSELRVLHGWTLAEVIELEFKLLAGEAVIAHTIGRFNDSYWLVTEGQTLRPPDSR
jgi:hypothetical protein